MSVWPKHWLSLISNRMLIIIMNRLILSLLCVVFLASCGVPEDPLEGQNTNPADEDAVSDPDGSSDDTDYTVDTSLSAPVTLITIAGDTQALLKWNSAPNADSYIVYYSDVTNPTESDYLILLDDYESTSYIIPAGTLVNDTTYTFAVVAKSDSSTLTTAAATTTSTSSVSEFSPIKTVTPEVNGRNLSVFTDVRELNDTGANYALSTSTHVSDCGAGDLYSELQDCAFGRDVDSLKTDDGELGFSFTKISSSGELLTVDSEDWDCVLDNVTGLMWEVKKGGNGEYSDEGLHDQDNEFTWYESNSSLVGSGADAGDDQNALDICDVDDTTACNTSAFVDRVNDSMLCGYSNWRMPSTNELLSIVSYKSIGTSGSTDLVDETFFPRPDTSNVWRYWTGNHYFDVDSNTGDEAWAIALRGSGLTGQAGKASGTIFSVSKSSLSGVMLVRDN